VSGFRFDADGAAVSKQDIIRDFLELDGPMQFAVALVVHRSKQVSDANWPLSSHDGGGHAGKPGSRGPGREQCSSAVRRLIRLGKDADNIWASVRVKPERGIETMGTVDIRIPAATGPSVARRGPYKRREAVEPRA
jgi:hypothetical protein